MSVAMSQSRTLRILALAAVLVAGGPALAMSHPTAKDPSTDSTGYMALGVDITTAGNSPQSVGAFLNDLPAHERRTLVYGCRSIAESPAFANQRVLQFCSTLIDITRNVPPAPPPPRWF
jgi:hypothetical protein